MEFSKFLFMLVHMISVIPNISAQFEFLNSRCGETTYSTPSAYQTNLNKALTSMSSDTQITYGYYNFSAGHKPDRAEVMALCRADISVETCQNCVRSAAATLPSVCHNKRQAVGYSEYCLLYFTNSSAFHVLTDEPYYALMFNGNITNIPQFNNSLTTLITTLQNKASLGNSEIKFATGKTNLTSNESLYGLVQCSPDLNRRQCVSCVQYLIDNTFSQYFITVKRQSLFMAKGARVISPSCNVRYELYPFYSNVTYAAQPPAQLPSPVSNRNSNSAQGNRTQKIYITFGLLQLLNILLLSIM